MTSSSIDGIEPSALAYPVPTMQSGMECDDDVAQWWNNSFTRDIPGSHCRCDSIPGSHCSKSYLVYRAHRSKQKVSEWFSKGNTELNRFAVRQFLHHSWQLFCHEDRKLFFTAGGLVSDLGGRWLGWPSLLVAIKVYTAPCVFVGIDWIESAQWEKNRNIRWMIQC